MLAGFRAGRDRIGAQVCRTHNYIFRLTWSGILSLMAPMLKRSMTQKIETWPELVKVWPDVAAFSRAVGVELSCSRGWMNRKSVRKVYFPQIVEALKAEGFTQATTEDLGALPWSKEETT